MHCFAPSSAYQVLTWIKSFRSVCIKGLDPGTWNMMIFFPAYPFPPSKLVVTAWLWFRSSKFLQTSLLLPMSLFLTLVQIQDVTIPMHSASLSNSCLTLCQRSFFHLGPKLWNKLPKNVASCVTLPSFKVAVRTIIMDKFSFVLSCLSIFFFFFLVLWVSFLFCCSFWLFGLPFNLALLHYWVLPGFGRML